MLTWNPRFGIATEAIILIKNTGVSNSDRNIKKGN